MMAQNPKNNMCGVIQSNMSGLSANLHGQNQQVTGRLKEHTSMSAPSQLKGNTESTRATIPWPTM